MLRGELERVAAAVSSGLNIYVMGSSHSALSAVAVILRHFRESLWPGQLRLVHRKVKTYYSSAAEAPSHAYVASDVDPETLEINRFDGIRADARRTIEAILAGREPAVELVPASDFVPRARRSLYISATGYTARQIMVANEVSGPVALASDRHGLIVDQSCRVVDGGGRAIPRLYGIGIGYARRGPTNIARVGVNFFHGEDGAMLARQLADDLPATVSLVGSEARQFWRNQSQGRRPEGERQ